MDKYVYNVAKWVIYITIAFVGITILLQLGKTMPGGVEDRCSDMCKAGDEKFFDYEPGNFYHNDVCLCQDKDGKIRSIVT